MSGTSVDLPLRDRRGVMICREPMQPRPSLASYTRRAARAASFGAFALASSCAPPSEPASPSIASMRVSVARAWLDPRTWPLRKEDEVELSPRFINFQTMLEVPGA